MRNKRLASNPTPRLSRPLIVPRISPHIPAGRQQSCCLTTVGLLEPLKSVVSDEGKELVLHIKPKSEDGTKECQALLDAMRSSSDAPVLGTLKDKHEGKFYPVWQAALEASGIATADVSSGVADLLSIKDAAEVMNVKKASFLAAKVRGRGRGRGRGSCARISRPSA